MQALETTNTKRKKPLETEAYYLAFAQISSPSANPSPHPYTSLKRKGLGRSLVRASHPVRTGCTLSYLGFYRGQSKAALFTRQKFAMSGEPSILAVGGIGTWCYLVSNGCFLLVFPHEQQRFTGGVEQQHTLSEHRFLSRLLCFPSFRGQICVWGWCRSENFPSPFQLHKGICRDCLPCAWQGKYLHDKFVRGTFTNGGREGWHVVSFLMSSGARDHVSTA